MTHSNMFEECFHLINCLFLSDPPAKFLMFTKMENLTQSSLSSRTYTSLSPKGQLFRFRFWYFIYDLDDGNLTVYISQYSSVISVGGETSLIWSTASHSVRNWQYQQIEMKALQTFSVSVFFSRIRASDKLRRIAMMFGSP